MSVIIIFLFVLIGSYYRWLNKKSNRQVEVFVLIFQVAGFASLAGFSENWIYLIAVIFVTIESSLYKKKIYQKGD